MTSTMIGTQFHNEVGGAAGLPHRAGTPSGVKGRCGTPPRRPRLRRRPAALGSGGGLRVLARALPVP